MKTKDELKHDFDIMSRHTQRFIKEAVANGGMTDEARVKLLENQIVSLTWFIAHIIEHIPTKPQ